MDQSDHDLLIRIDQIVNDIKNDLAEGRAKMSSHESRLQALESKFAFSRGSWTTIVVAGSFIGGIITIVIEALKYAKII